MAKITIELDTVDDRKLIELIEQLIELLEKSVQAWNADHLGSSGSCVDCVRANGGLVHRLLL